jgi:Domain of unknown function (DUF4260)
LKGAAIGNSSANSAGRRVSGFAQGPPLILLRLEGLATLAAALAAYASLHGGWQLFALLFLAPDIAFLAYLRGPAFGAAAYNAPHTYLIPIAIGLMAYALNRLEMLPFAVIWIAHIGFDRALGYGLKYATAFGDSHLGLVGRRQG